jgi:signal peptidase I
MNSPTERDHLFTVAMLADMQSVQPRTSQRWLLRLMWEAVLFVTILIVLYGVGNLVTPRFLIEGTSMEPNFHNQERIVVSRLDYWLGKPERGQVIVFRYDQHTYLIKRIIGLPGEKVEINAGQVYVNGEPLAEAYIAETCTLCQKQAWLLGEDEYFVLGDNRNTSLDSHNFGPIKESQIVGRVRVRYWPIHDAEWVAGYHY